MVAILFVRDNELTTQKQNKNTVVAQLTISGSLNIVGSGDENFSNKYIQVKTQERKEYESFVAIVFH